MTTVYSIYPAIGIARVGNAPDYYYLAPNAINGLPLDKETGEPITRPAQFRDDQHRLARQAAEFRIYKTLDDGTQEEVTLDSPDVQSIEWTVHLANKKSSWYAFSTNKGEQGYASNHPLRNPDKTATTDRQRLNIDAGPRTISGANAPAEHFSREGLRKLKGYTGSFPPEDLKPFNINTLGELRTDVDGRLHVLGGLGHSGSEIHPPTIGNYANNDGWWDDTSDGPVSVTLTLTDNTKIVVADAWVLVGPPSYAPEIGNIVTLYDTIFDVVVRKQGLRPEIFQDELWNSGADGFRPNYDTDIRPIFERAQNYPWVTAIPPKPHSFDLDKLGNPDPQFNGYRKYFLDIIRAPGQENTLINPVSGATMMPYLAGDDAIGAPALDQPSEATARYLRLTDTQYFMLTQWANGWFKTGSAPVEQPGDALTRATLENCVGGAFSPGIEMTWISRNPDIYDGPFRIKHRQDVPDPLSLGFDPQAGMEPGDILRYMACPWQADFDECSSQPIDGRVLWWWPAQRPEFVYEVQAKGELKLGGATGNEVETLPGQQYGAQVAWVGQVYNQNVNGYLTFLTDIGMVENWDKLGFVTNIGTPDKPHFVEVARRIGRTPGAESDTSPTDVAEPGAGGEPG